MIQWIQWGYAPPFSNSTYASTKTIPDRASFHNNSDLGAISVTVRKRSGTCRIVSVPHLGAVWLSKIHRRGRISSANCYVCVDCEQSLFFFRFSEGSACAVRRWDARTRASPVSRRQSRAWSFACLALFARWTKKKERLLVVYVCEAELVLCRCYSYYTWQPSVSPWKTMQYSVNIAWA